MKVRNRSILCIGECMVELSPTGSGTFSKGFAGDTFNTAWYLKSALPAGWSISYLTGLGDDTNSDEMVDFIGAAGIGTQDIIRFSHKNAGLYMIHLKNGERRFSYWRENAAARALADDLGKLEASMQRAGIIYFSGISLAILQGNGRNNLLSALANARKKGTVIVFDPNLRPRLWEHADTMRDEVMRAASVSDIVLPSFDDEAEHFGDINPEATLKRYQQVGAKVIVVKNAEGPILATGSTERNMTFAPEIVESPVDTTAAGDSFNAGFLATYLRGGDLLAALKAGSSLSAKVINQRGALVNLKP